jgi:hypothetical protein
MKKTSSAMIKMVVVLLAVFSLMITASAGSVSPTVKIEKTIQGKNAPTDFYANITIHLCEDEVCDCYPPRDIPINATGIDTNHFTSGLTNDNGMCVLQLEFDKTSRVSIQDPNHESVLVDFVVLDDQAFSFHTKIVQGSSQGGTFLQMILHTFLLEKKIIS